jgi:hypothetical protein
MSDNLISFFVGFLPSASFCVYLFIHYRLNFFISGDEKDLKIKKLEEELSSRNNSTIISCLHDKLMDKDIEIARLQAIIQESVSL